MPTSIVKCDVMFRCMGKIMDENRFKQGVLSPFVRAHGRILAKRCLWLGKLIETARLEKEVTEREEEEEVEGVAVIEGGRNVVIRKMQLEGRLVSEVVEGGHAEQEEEDEDDDGILPAPVQPNQNNLERREDNGVGGVELPQIPQANAVEDDEDEDSLNNNSSSSVTNAVPIDGTNESVRSESPIHASNNNSNMSINSSTNYNPLIIPLSHPPEAVKLLLEYCYTNRVLPLGYEAFQKSYRKPDLNTPDSPVGPYPPTFSQASRASWSNGGKPTVSLSVALAGIRLAEEVELPRLSLLCEIAASQLVTAQTLLESLALCEESKRGKGGNGLAILRRAVMMQHVLAHGSRGVSELAAMPSFQRGLQERGDVVVPSLLTGVAEAIKIGGKGGDGGKRKGKKSDFAEERTKSMFRK